MGHLLLDRLLRVIAILFCTTLLTFLLMHAMRGSPWDSYSNTPRAMPNVGTDLSVQRELNRFYGLNLPLWRQFTRYLFADINADGTISCGVICGNLGPSIRQRGRSVGDVLFSPPEGKTFWESRFGYSIRLVLLASLLAVGLGIPFGIASAVDPRSAVSHTISFGLAALISIPNFVLGLLSIVVFAVGLGITKVLPNWNDPRSWIIPAVVLAVMPMASTARVARASLLNVLHEDYVRTARAKGLRETRVVLVHVMRNAIVPIITFLGPALMEMFTGLFVVEFLFSFPGFGREYWESVLALDYPTILGLTLLYALGIVLVTLCIELLTEIFDPRLREIKEQGAA